MTDNCTFFTHAWRAAWCCSATVALGGCVAEMNGDPVVFEPATHALEGAPPVSVTGLSRADWPATTVGVPSGYVAHQPTYAADFTVHPDSPRRAGDYPTIDTAIQTGRDDGSAQVEALAAYPHVGFLFLKVPFEVIGGDWPWSINTSEAEYERTRDR